MAKAKSDSANPIDTLMERASRALVRRHYFEAERLSADALRAAYAAGDCERMARVLLPLEEARRQKRDLAFDARHVAIVNGPLPDGDELTAGCYLVCPPRVGVDGRMLREAADHKGVPTIIVVREPTTRDGLWPVVALGPVTVRAKVSPPPAPRARGGSAKAGAARTSKPKSSHGPTNGRPDSDPVPPSRSWFLRANELLGDAAIASIDPELDPIGRVDALFKRLEAHPDHEKLHQALADACRACTAHIAAHGRPKRPASDAERARARRGDYDPDL